MGFSLKRRGAHFCPPPIWAAKKACFLPPFQGFGHVAHMFFRFLLHRFCVFLHEFCIFSHYFVKFSACANAYWQISRVITSIISELAKVQSPNKNGKSVAICKAFALYLCFCFTLRPAIFNSAMRRLPLVQGVWNILVSSLVRWQARVIYKSATKDVEALMNKTSVLFIYF